MLNFRFKRPVLDDIGRWKSGSFGRWSSPQSFAKGEEGEKVKRKTAEGKLIVLYHD